MLVRFTYQVLRSNDAYPRVDRSGLDSIWFYEVPLEEETFVRAGYVAALTERLKISAGIFSPLIRHPATIAMGAATLNHLSKGRSFVIMSAGVRNWLRDKLGMSFTHQKARRVLDEALPVVRKLLAGETANYRGKTFSISGRLDYPPEERNVPIYLAAGHEGMLRCAGKSADGVLLFFWPPVEYVRWATRMVKSTAEDRRVEIGAFMTIRITANKKEARKELKNELAFYFSDPDNGPLFLDKGGFEERIGPQLRKIWQASDYKLRDPGPFLKLIPDELVDEFTLIGSIDEIRERLALYEKAGMTYVVLAFQSRFDEYIGQIPQLLD